jgi:SAM-dependent methyltransferase
MDPWFDLAFGPRYDELYPHRDDADAARDVARVLAAGVDPARRTLDHCCGPGRHLEALARDGGFGRLVGLDRSAHQLERARQRLGPEARLVRGDMRGLPFATAGFDLVLNLFTSFGYFDDDADHRRTLLEVHRVLAPGGRFHLDHVDRAHLEATLVPRSRVTVAGRHLLCTRQLVGDHVEKRLLSPRGRQEHLERVRVWYPGPFQELLATCGFQELEVTLEDGRMRVWARRP